MRNMASRVGLAVTFALAVLAAPVAGPAQQPGKTARIGYLSPLSAGADAAQFEAFRQGLRALGYVDGQNIAIEARHGDGRFERLPDLAAELGRPHPVSRVVISRILRSPDEW